jgi:hypothetical protein
MRESGHSTRKFAARRRPVITVALVGALLAVVGGAAGVRLLDRAHQQPEGVRGTAVSPAPATRITMWTKCADIASLPDAQLDYWHSIGVSGFVCTASLFPATGEGDQFTDLDASLAEQKFSVEKRLRDSKLAERAAAHGIKLYLAFNLNNQSYTGSPLADWFDDDAWSNKVIPTITTLTKVAHQLGFAGIGFDEEMYPPPKGLPMSTWSWKYPGSVHTEPEVRAKAVERGQQLMTAIVGVFPNVEIVDYGAFFPETWAAHVQQVVNKIPDAGRGSVAINFWDGLTRVDGYGTILFLDSAFYKSPNLSGEINWDTALGYNVNHWMAFFSRSLANWNNASSRVCVSPFAWIDGDVKNEGAWTAPRAPKYVADQLQAFRNWAMCGEFGVFMYSGVHGFNYGPYADGLRAAAQAPSAPSSTTTSSPAGTASGSASGTASASASGTASGSLPTLTVDPDPVTPGDGRKGTLSGTARDNLGIRTVRWQTDDGTSGVAALSWTATGDDRKGYDWTIDWQATGIPLHAGANRVTITVENLAGGTSSATIPVE